MKPSKIKNILFITSTRLGDAVISTGILDYLLKTYPQAMFTIACGPVAAGIFERMPRRKETIIMYKQRYDLHWFHLWRRCIMQSWDLIVDLRGSAISLCLSSKKRIVIRGGRIGGRRIEHLAKAFLLAPAPLPVMWMNKEDHSKAREHLPGQDYIALAPTANWMGKVWPIERFIELAKRILLTYPTMQFAVFYGPGQQEYEMVRPLLSINLPTIDVGGDFTLAQVGAMLSRCKGFVGNDSGLMHLAASCQIPVLGLFGPSKVSEYAPAGLYARAIVAKGEEGKASMNALLVNDVFIAFKQLLADQEKILKNENF
ncbi:glycosyltransferase family 9 protein [Commensalibacter oyaizuii]|uniref:Glycosyltransferase family 9 protein n=1 Tax=Commensalibacter oyaizuii TaxID=3043873 RepID=A0ABT6Q131_9PROT|nr:glycosyltransferase family 9 protein [Commensalibacter sp. TBRC 16381]MDI2090446.1 glycosyltransferase family 9 protein [Commensalibacter sp. TBRC 16381]